MTSYVLIRPNGELSFKDGDHRAEIGPEGANQVWLHPARRAAGWVNDCGLLLPERYPRNVIGSILLICLGATPQPYAGPVAVTGWHPRREVCDLPGEAREYLPELVRDIALVLDGEPPASPWVTGEWAAAVADAADAIRTAPVVPTRLMSVEELS